MASRLFKLFLLVFFAAATAASFIPYKASALGSSAPDTAGTFPTSADHQYNTYFVVSNTSNVVIDDTYVKVYFPDNGAHTVTIVSPHSCWSDDPDFDDVGNAMAHGDNDTEFMIYRTAIDSVNQTEVQTGAYLDRVVGEARWSGACPDLDLNIPAGSLTYSPYVNAWVALIHVNKYNSSGGQNSFFVRAGAGNIVGLIGKQDARNVGYEVVGRNDSDGDGVSYVDHNLKFAPDCTLTAPGWQTLRFYDPDNGTAGIQSTLFYFRVWDETNGNYLTAGEYSNPTNMSGSHLGWNPGNTSNTYSTVRIWMEPGHRYQWRINNIYDNNTIQVEQPYDSIYYSRPCTPTSVSPVVEPVVNGAPGTQAELLDDVGFKFRVNNDAPGLFAAKTSYSGRVYRDNPSPIPDVDLFTFNGGGTSAAPTFNIPAGSPNPTACSAGCSYTTDTADGGNAAHVYNAIADFATHGSQVCAVFTVNPRNSVEVPPTAETTAVPICIKIGKRPLFGARGGDVWAGGTFGSIGTCPVQSPKPFIRSSTKAYTVPRPGFPVTEVSSIGEYGAFSLGAIGGFGTNRSVFKNASTDISWNLMFANTTVPPGSFYDGPPADTGRCLTDVFSLFTQGLPTTSSNNIMPASAPSQITNAGGTVTVNGGIIGANKRFVLYAPNATVVQLTGNITYDNGPFANPQQMPEVVILTNGDIVVDPGVTQLDGIISARGILYTCVPAANIASRNTPSTFIRIDAPCQFPLTFNGTVIAEDVRMYRTAGATTVAGDNRAVPAEVFNLRGDMFLSEYGRATQLNRQARTIHQKELPPRY